MNLNIIFQGGGANLVTLMAAAAALEQVLQNDKFEEWEIETVTGVSAGAVVACMLSSHEPTISYRAIAESEARKVIDDFSISKKYHLPESPKWHNIGKYLKPLKVVAKGNSLLDESKLESLYSAIFQNQGLQNVSYLRDLKYKTYLTTTDLKKNSRVSFDRSSHGGVPIEELLVHSSAIPFVFRGYAERSGYVDGGLTGNLPLGLLDKSVGSERQILAFGFKEDTAGYKFQFLSYLKKAFSALIDGAVHQNLKRIESVGGKTILLDRDFELTEFERALDDGLGLENFNKSVKKISEDILIKLSEMKKDTQFFHSMDEVKAELKKSHQYLEDNASLEKTSKVTICRMDSLDVNLDKKDRLDSILQETHYYPDKGGAQVVSNNLVILQGQSVRRGNVTVVDSNRDEIQHVVFNADRETSGDGSKTYLHSFFILDRNYTKDDGHFIVSHTTEGEVFKEFSLFGVDYLRHIPHLEHGTAEAVQIFLIPKSFCSKGQFTLYDLKTHFRLLEAKGCEPLDHVDKMLAAFVEGKSMTPSMLKKYLGPIVVSDYHVYGWKTENVPYQNFCGVILANKQKITADDLSACEI